jgi:hypothetical protein
MPKPVRTARLLEHLGVVVAQHDPEPNEPRMANSAIVTSTRNLNGASLPGELEPPLLEHQRQHQRCEQQGRACRPRLAVLP